MRAGRFPAAARRPRGSLSPLTPRCEGDETHARLAPREAAAILSLTIGNDFALRGSLPGKREQDDPGAADVEDYGQAGKRRFQRGFSASHSPIGVGSVGAAPASVRHDGAGGLCPRWIASEGAAADLRIYRRQYRPADQRRVCWQDWQTCRSATSCGLSSSPWVSRLTTT